MDHFPLMQSENPNEILYFSHFDYDAPAGKWKKENVIVLDRIKINVFVEGTFSVFSDGTLHQPILGDVCVLPPMKMHYGQIKIPMHINYYQLDIGLSVFAAIPGGATLLERLLRVVTHNDSFLQPEPEQKDAVLSLCQEIEVAIRKDALFLAYAKVIELLCLLDFLYSRPTRQTGGAFSLRVAQTVRYLEEHYAQSITVKELAEEIGISPSFLCRTFKKETGVSVHEYLNQYRVLKSVEFLKNHSVTETGYLCGFCDSSHFISVFKKNMRMTPMQYKKQYLFFRHSAKVGAHVVSDTEAIPSDIREFRQRLL